MPSDDCAKKCIPRTLLRRHHMVWCLQLRQANSSWEKDWKGTGTYHYIHLHTNTENSNRWLKIQNQRFYNCLVQSTEERQRILLASNEAAVVQNMQRTSSDCTSLAAGTADMAGTVGTVGTVGSDSHQSSCWCPGVLAAPIFCDDLTTTLPQHAVLPDRGSCCPCKRHCLHKLPEHIGTP